MRYRVLADTGVFVSELCLGAMTFGGQGSMYAVIGGLDQPTVDTIVLRSLDAGVNFIDTADVYSAGESETMLGKALAGRRHHVVLATKVRGRTAKGHNDVGLSRAERLERFKCTQSYYSLVGRELEREMVPLLADQRVGLLVWSPLAGGFLTGKFTRDAKDASARRASFNFPPIDLEKAFDIVDVARTIAANHGASIAQVAIAWLLSRDAVTSVIIGARTPAQLDDNLKSADVRLSPEEIRLLDEVSRLEPEYPTWLDLMPSDRLPGEERRFDTVRA